MPDIPLDKKAVVVMNPNGKSAEPNFTEIDISNVLPFYDYNYMITSTKLFDKNTTCTCK
jgi:hypothetical protein